MNAKPLPEYRNSLTMWTTGPNYTPPVAEETPEPVVRRNYFALPGFMEQPVTPMPYVREVGKMPGLQFKPEHIRKVVLKTLKIDYETLLNTSREMHLVDNRCILVWLCYKYAYTTGMKKIANLIGRDRTSAMHLVTRANNAIATNVTGFVEKLQLVERELVNQRAG